MFPLNLPNARILLVPVALTVESPGGLDDRGDRVRHRRLHGRPRRLHRPFAPGGHELRQGDGPGRGQAHGRRRADRAGERRPARRLVAIDPDAAWVQALVYAMVGVTVLSGADYFLNFRKKLEEASRSAETSRA